MTAKTWTLEVRTTRSSPWAESSIGWTDLEKVKALVDVAAGHYRIVFEDNSIYGRDFPNDPEEQGRLSRQPSYDSHRTARPRQGGPKEDECFKDEF